MAKRDVDFTCSDCGESGFKSGKAVADHKKVCPALTKSIPADVVEVKVEEQDAPKEASLYDTLVAEFTATKQAMQEQIDSLTAENEGLRGELEAARHEPSMEAFQKIAGALGIGYIVVKENRYPVIPTRFLPNEMKYLGKDAFTGIKARGRLSEDGLIVTERIERI